MASEFHSRCDHQGPRRGPKKSRADVVEEFSRDPTTKLIARAAVEPIKASGFPGSSTLAAFKALAPRAASIAVLEMETEVDLTGVDQYAFPLAASFTSASWVAEGAEIPIGQGVFVSMLLGRLKKIALIAGLSDGIESATAGKASDIIAHTIEVMIGRGLDLKLFSGDAPSSVAPPGLLWGVTPIAAGASMADDLSGLVTKIAESNLNTESIIFVATPSLATKIKLIAGPHFNHRVIGANIATDSIIAIATSGLAVAGSGEQSLPRPYSIAFIVPMAITATGPQECRGKSQSLRPYSDNRPTPKHHVSASSGEATLRRRSLPRSNGTAKAGSRSLLWLSTTTASYTAPKSTSCAPRSRGPRQRRATGTLRSSICHRRCHYEVDAMADNRERPLSDAAKRLMRAADDATPMSLEAKRLLRFATVAGLKLDAQEMTTFYAGLNEADRKVLATLLGADGWT